MIEIDLHNFLNLKFGHEYHDYHNEGTKCIYQDLIKNQLSIREIIYTIASDDEYLNPDKYFNSEDSRIKYDHMQHFIHCILHGFKKDIINWEDLEAKHKLVDGDYYASLPAMSDEEINILLNDNPITVAKGGIIVDGLHRGFCMIGRILRGEAYIPFQADTSRYFRLKHKLFPRTGRRQIRNIGYRLRDNKSRYEQMKPHITKKNFSLLDVGSNFGYFSLSLSLDYPNSRVFSVEGSYGTGNEDMYGKPDYDFVKSKGLQTHLKYKRKHSVFNNHIFCMLMTKNQLDALHQKNIRFDYQLSLSVFHWIAYEKYGNDGDPLKLYQLLVKQITLANKTFIELPDIEQQTSLSPAYKGHDSMHSVLTHVKNNFINDMEFELLGSHKWCGNRDLYKITIQRPIQNEISATVLKDILSPFHTL